MDEKDKALASALVSLYYMMGVIEASDCKAQYDFVLESMTKIEELLFGGAL